MAVLLLAIAMGTSASAGRTNVTVQGQGTCGETACNLELSADGNAELLSGRGELSDSHGEDIEFSFTGTCANGCSVVSLQGSVIDSDLPNFVGIGSGISITAEASTGAITVTVSGETGATATYTLTGTVTTTSG